MSLILKIKKYLRRRGQAARLAEIYKAFPEEKKSTIRGRIYENVGKGLYKVDKGLYISAEALIEHANIMDRIDDMVAAGMKYDFVFLDIPYLTDGQYGGNRCIIKYDTISTDQFSDLLRKLKLVLEDEGTLHFMITSGKSSKKQSDAYKKKFEEAGYLKIHTGEYVKMNKNGTRCNIGKYLLPPEEIIVYAKKELITSDWQKVYEEVRPKGYPTQKPVSLMEKLILRATKIGQWVLDPFGGSGSTLEACINTKRKCHIMDISEESVYNYILPIVS